MNKYKAPRIIESRFDTICKETGKPIKKGQSCLYFPSSRAIFHFDSNEVREWRNMKANESQGYTY